MKNLKLNVTKDEISKDEIKMKAKKLSVGYTYRNDFFNSSIYWDEEGECVDIVIIDDFNKITKMNSEEINNLLCPCPAEAAGRLYEIVKSNDDKYFIAIPNLQILSEENENEFFIRCESLGKNNPEHLQFCGNLIGYSENLGLSTSYEFE